jgi:hypothetical protein
MLRRGPVSAAFDKLRLREIVCGIKITPHAEPVEARIAPIHAFI